MDAHSFVSRTTAMEASPGDDLPQVAPLNLSRPLPAESKAGRRTPVPIILPPKYDHAAPHRGLASEPWSASLDSAASTIVDSVFSPAYTDGYQTPLSSIGSPAFLAPSPFTDKFGRKQSIDSIICAAAAVEEEPDVVEADHDLDLVDDQLSQVTLVRDTASPVSPVSEPEADLEATELTFDLEQHIHDIRVSAFSATSDEFSPSELTYRSKSSSLSHDTVVSLSTDYSPTALSRSASDAKDDDIPHHGFGPAWESSSVALLLDRTGKDARARRSPRGSSQYYRESTSFPTEIIAMATVEVPSPLEVEMTRTATSTGGSPPRRNSNDLPSPVAPAYIADDKIAIDSFDDEKIFIPGAADMPAARSHFSWGSTPPQRRNNNNTITNPAFRQQQQQQDADGIYAASPIAATHRINAFTYAQSRHEYSKARRMNFHLPATASRAGMHRDAMTNANPSVLAAELDGAASLPPQQYPQQQQHQLSPPPSASSAGGKQYLSSSSHTSSVRGSPTTTRGGGQDLAASSKGGCFGSLFGSCFGPRR